MTAFGPERADEVFSACQSAASAIGDAFSSTFGGALQSRPTQPDRLDLQALAPQLAGAGLSIEFTVDGTRCLAVVSQPGPLLPDWCSDPNDADQQKLAQFGTALITALLPVGTVGQLTDVRYHGDLEAAVQQSQPDQQAVHLPVEIAKDDDDVARLSLIWPVTNAIDEKAQIGGGQDKASSSADPVVSGVLPEHRRLIYRNLEDGIRQLPAYARSLLRVQVPVTVTLASSKTPISKVLNMGPGTILQFKKACDSNLTLEVGRQTVAEGEAVKVGDKFGLWITSMTMPGERFWSVQKASPPERVK